MFPGLIRTGQADGFEQPGIANQDEIEFTVIDPGYGCSVIAPAIPTAVGGQRKQKPPCIGFSPVDRHG